MKRKLFASAMAGILAVSALTGCSSGEAAPNAGNEAPVAIEIPDMTQPTSIEMWHFMSGKQQEVLQSIIDEFNATNSLNITVSAVAQGKIPDLNKKVIAAQQSKTLPAIINVYPDLATGLIEKGSIYDISAFAAHPEVGMLEDLKTDFIAPFIAEVSQWDGKLYGMPMTKSTEVIYVNKTLLEKIGYTEADVQGMTMDKLAEISKAAKEQLGIAGFGYDSGSNGFISTLKMDGMDFVELNGTINVDNEWVRTFMDFYKEQVQNGYFRTPGEDGFLSGPFSNQQMLMYQGSTAGASFINTNGEFEVIAVEPAYFEGKDHAVIQQGGSLFITNDVTPQEQYAAYEFIKFATNTENTAKFATETGYLPVRQSAAETTTVQNVLADPNAIYAKVYPVAQTALGYAYYTPAINNAQSARNTIQEKFDAYVNGNIADMDTFIQETLSEVGTSIQRQ
ncbi:MAG: extracellular solute-binding protein [Candidatus Niameybacter stercoravium]|nr:extracellular solute-binding protein [Candidatus Niameybacter stercoravium]